MHKYRSAYIIAFCISFLLLAFFIPTSIVAAPVLIEIEKDTIIIKTGITNERISAEWKITLTSRMNRERIDSFGRLQRALTKEEQAWKKLIASRTKTWNTFKDSLVVPFDDVQISDTINVLLGFLGNDDGFTYGYQTVCLDLTALNNAYGQADLPENNNRIDRIFAHEYTHLLHKIWANNKGLRLETFKDSILWECLYEGTGMYRSLNPKWMPVAGELPGLSKTTLENLYPIFVDRLTTIETAKTLTLEEKERLNKNLSRGSVNQKWGAFPVAIWLALEADGDDEKLKSWISRGPESVIQLAKKYLTADHQQKLNAVFK